MLADIYKGRIYLESHINGMRISRVTPNGHLIPCYVSDTNQDWIPLKNIRNNEHRGGLFIILTPKHPLFTSLGMKSNHCQITFKITFLFKFITHLYILRAS